MDERPFVEHVLNDESITAALDDDAAGVLLDWLTARVAAAAASAGDEASVWLATREAKAAARRVAKATAALIENGPDAAATTLAISDAKSARAAQLAALRDAAPSDIVRSILAWEVNEHG